MCTWKNNLDLMTRLESVQNHPHFNHQDILSFAGMCSDRAELLRHVENCEKRAGVETEKQLPEWAVNFYRRAGREDIISELRAIRAAR